MRGIEYGMRDDAAVVPANERRKPGRSANKVNDAGVRSADTGRELRDTEIVS